MSGRWWLVGRIFHMRVVTLMVLVALFAWALYRFSRPTDRSLGYLRRKAMTAVAAKVADALPRHGQVRTLAVLPLDGDSDRLVRTFLVNQIREAKTIFQVTQADFMHRMQLEIQQPAKSMEEALVAAKL